MKKQVIYSSMIIAALFLAFIALHFIFRIDANAEPWAILVLISFGVVLFYFLTRKVQSMD